MEATYLSVKTLLTQYSRVQALMKRNQDLTPSEKEASAVNNLVSKIQGVLDILIVTPGNFDACVSHTLLVFCYKTS